MQAAVDETMHVSAVRSVAGIKDAFCRPAGKRPYVIAIPRQVASIRRSEDPLHAKHQLIAFAHVLRADLVVCVDEVEPLVPVHYESWPNRTNLLLGIRQR